MKIYETHQIIKIEYWRLAADAVAYKSAAVRSAPPAGVLGAIVEKPRLTS